MTGLTILRKFSCVTGSLSSAQILGKKLLRRLSIQKATSTSRKLTGPYQVTHPLTVKLL